MAYWIAVVAVAQVVITKAIVRDSNPTKASLAPLVSLSALSTELLMTEVSEKKISLLRLEILFVKGYF